MVKIKIVENVVFTLKTVLEMGYMSKNPYITYISNFGTFSISKKSQKKFSCLQYCMYNDQIWTQHVSWYNTTFVQKRFFNLIFFLEFFDPLKLSKITEKPLKRVPHRQKMKFWKNFLDKSCIMPLYMLYPNFIIVGALLAAWKLLEWFF